MDETVTGGGGDRAGDEDGRGHRAESLARTHHDLKTQLAILHGWQETLERSWDRLGEAHAQEAIRAMARALGALREQIDALLGELRAEAAANDDRWRDG